jgi:hypothetical protein
MAKSKEKAKELDWLEYPKDKYSKKMQIVSDVKKYYDQGYYDGLRDGREGVIREIKQFKKNRFFEGYDNRPIWIINKSDWKKFEKVDFGWEKFKKEWESFKHGKKQ